jgi:hypothetical protein
MKTGSSKVEVSAFVPPTSDYLGADPVGTRFAAMKRAAWNPKTLAHHLCKSVAEVMPVLRNESDDAKLIREVDAALGILPDATPDLSDAPAESSPPSVASAESVESVPDLTSDLRPLTSASEDPDYLAELAEGLAAAEDETLHLASQPPEPDFATSRNILMTKLFDVLRESGGDITLETIDRDMHAPSGTARNVLIGDARHAKVEDYLCWLTNMDRLLCWPADGSHLVNPWPRIPYARSAPRRVKPCAPCSPLPAFSTPKGPRT